MRLVSIVLNFILLLLCQFTCAQTPKLIINNQNQAYQLNTYLGLLKDSTQKMTLFDLMTTPSLKFLPLNGEIYPLNKDKIIFSYWLRMEVDNQSQENIFHINFSPRLDSIEFYSLQKDGQWQQSVAGLKKSNELDYFNFSLTKLIYLKKGENTIYFRVSGNSLLHREQGIILGYLRNSKEFQKNNGFENFCFALVLGILSFMFFYSLWVYIATKKSIYGVFIIYSLIDILFVYHLAKPNLLWAYFGMPFWVFYLHYPLYLLSIVAKTWFAQHFLETNYYTPLGDNALIFIKILALLGLILMPLGYFNLVVNFSHFLLFLSLVVSTIIAIYRLRQGFKDASYFLSANVVSLLMMVFVIWKFITLQDIDFIFWVIAPISEILYFIILARTLVVQVNDLYKDVLEKENNLKNEKERISRDLHDNIGSQLTYLVRSFGRIKSIEDIGEIDKLTEQAKYIIQDLRSTIWVLNKESMSIKDFSEKILSLLWKVQEQMENASFSLVTNGADNIYLNNSQAINLYRIIQEALHNSIKYSEATVIKIEINTDEFVNKPFIFSIRIEDNGKGFDIKILPVLGKSNFGLISMEQRANEIGGTLLIQTAKDEGTIIEVHL